MIHRALSYDLTRSSQRATIVISSELQDCCSRDTNKSPHHDLAYTACIMVTQPLYGTCRLPYNVPEKIQDYKQPISSIVCRDGALQAARQTHHRCMIPKLPYRLVAGQRPRERISRRWHAHYCCHITFKAKIYVQ